MYLRPAINVINDTIVPGPHNPFEHLTPRETETRNAFYILSLGVPLVGALFALSTGKRWRKDASVWSFPSLCAVWFVTIAAFATIIFFHPGRVTRSTFLLAIIHGMVEISIISFLLDASFSQSLIASMIFGLVDFTFALALPDISAVFLFAAIAGGMNDVLLPLLLIYGRQPLLAAGAIGHTVAAFSVFTAAVHDYGIIAFTIISLLSMWMHVGFVVAGLRGNGIPAEEQPLNLNPMKRSVSARTLAQFILISLAVSTVAAMLLAYVAPKI